MRNRFRANILPLEFFCCCFSASRTTPYSLRHSETSQLKQHRQRQREERLHPVKGSGDQMARGSHCFPDCVFHSLNKQPVETIGAGGDATCADIFSFQLQEVVLDLRVPDPAVGRMAASCGNKTPPHRCGSSWTVLQTQLGSHQPHNGWCSPGLFHGFHALGQGGLKAAALTSPFPLTRSSSRNTQ